MNYIYVDSPPKYEGTFLVFMKEHLEWNDRLDECPTGTVLLECFINVSGEIDKVMLYGSLCDIHNSAALELLSKSRKWIPAIKDGKAVACRFILPIFFIPSVLDE
jgi:hypothetical protein